MAFPGMGGGIGLPGSRNVGVHPQQMQEQMMVRYMQAAMESCVGKTAIAGVMGFGLGGMFGLFMSSMRYDVALTPQSQTLASLPVREQLRQGFKDMGRSSWSSAKNFGYIGAVFSGTECAIEGFRAKDDLWNGVSAGCITGAVLAKSGGPQAAAVGCAGFAAFSAAIDAYMRMPSDDSASDPII